ncbi:MAG: hypothetical protein GVY21_08965 [Gammaproteobacteria bacterium]|jgi:hypothetical protein|nr:hypothetical protein [Gammaproteobacteria bacterium]
MALRALAVLVVFCLGGAAGWWMGAVERPSPVEAPRGTADAAAAAPVRPDVAASRSVPPGSGKPPGTLLELLALDSDFAQTAALYQLAAGADAADLERLLGEVSQVPGGVDRRAAVSILYGRYADLDPAAAVDHLLRQRSIHEDVGLRAIFHAWARLDLQAAIARAEELAPSQRHHAGAVMLLARHDLRFSEQQRIAERLGIESVLRQVAARQSVDAMQVDPQGEWQRVVAEPPGPIRQHRLAAVLRAWAGLDPLAALNAVQSLPEAGTRRNLVQQVVQVWSERDPRAAMDWAMAQPPSGQRGHYLGVALRALSRSDPRSAFDLALALPAGDRDDAVGNVLGEWASADPAAAAAALARVSGETVNYSALSQVAMHYVGRDPDAATGWLATLDERRAAMATSMMFSVLGRQRPQEAARLVDDLPGALRRQASQSLVQTWAAQDPVTAARWVDDMVDPALRAEAGRALTRQWARYDVDAALRYADAIVERQEREAALLGVLESRRIEPARAEDIYADIRDEAHRRQAAQRLYMLYQQSDPDRAERFREAAGIGAPNGTGRPAASFLTEGRGP